MTAEASAAAALQDTFNGDDAKLIRCIEALLSLDAAGALAPHGVGGHARTLLESAAARLAASAQVREVGPDYPDGYDHEGFPGGDERMKGNDFAFTAAEPHCSGHARFDIDCIDCSDALERQHKPAAEPCKTESVRVGFSSQEAR